MASTLDISRWAHRIEKSDDPTVRYVRIALETVEPNRPDANEPENEARGGPTPRQLHAALLEERKRGPDLRLTFGARTERALRAWLGSPDRAWRKITGHGLDEYQALPHRKDDNTGPVHGPPAHSHPPYFNARSITATLPIMPRPKGFDPQHALEAAMTTFWNKGYAATSAQDLVDSTGLGRGSLYNTFRSKHVLFEAALRQYEAVWTARQVDVLEGDGPVRERLRTVLMTVVDEESTDTPEHRGCLAVNSALELAGQDQEVTTLVRRIFTRMEDALCAAIQRGQRDGEIDKGQDARGLAQYVLNSMYGLRVLGKTADRTSLTGIVDRVLQTL
ncbi:TetR/AcrR family transcriptional regulator [Streptomyces niger]|uniref:TetR/AcrR family transcriptional regulator n=1 Tax=Streptomyces niger TaxID=66373 RepID=UPI001F2AE37A|nr:TetR/AcrR family transcriptional regulator [Streptomyces niger]